MEFYDMNCEKKNYYNMNDTVRIFNMNDTKLESYKIYYTQLESYNIYDTLLVFYDIYDTHLESYNIYDTQLECCGASGPHDYATSTWFNLTRQTDGLFVPYSCCIMLDQNSPNPRPRNASACQVNALRYRPGEVMNSKFLHTRVNMMHHLASHVN